MKTPVHFLNLVHFLRLPAKNTEKHFWYFHMSRIPAVNLKICLYFYKPFWFLFYQARSSIRCLLNMCFIIIIYLQCFNFAYQFLMEYYLKIIKCWIISVVLNANGLIFSNWVALLFLKSILQSIMLKNSCRRNILKAIKIQ